MTYSIVGRSEDGSAYGVAVASRFLSVGSVVPWVGLRGAVASQSLVNPVHKSAAGARLSEGWTATETLEDLLATDDRPHERGERQLGLVDSAGGSATFTGDECWDWAGGDSGTNFAAQGNILAGPGVVAAMVDEWRAASSGVHLARRLVDALLAGDQAGGDRRGRQSATVIVVSAGKGLCGGDVEVDLRVDDHETPVHELTRLLDLHELYWGQPDPDTSLVLEGELRSEVAQLLGLDGDAEEEVFEAALTGWADRENISGRLMSGRLDQSMLRVLRHKGASAY